MNIEDQIDAQRELYKRQYQDLNDRLNALERLVSEACSLIDSSNSKSELTEVTTGFYVDLSSIQQVSVNESAQPPKAFVNWQLVGTETALGVLKALMDRPL